jgi:methionyl-tRNA formyltransferase
MPLRIVFTTNDSVNGQRILRALSQRGIRPDAIVLLGSGLRPSRRPGMSRARALLRWPATLAAALRRRWGLRFGRRRSYLAFSDDVVVAAGMNSGSMQRALRRRSPDLLVLGGGGILKPETIDLARRAVLNAHPALLPWIRGSGVVGHSLEQGVPLGATVHYVDRGIDTGAVIARRLLPVDPGPADLSELEAAAGELAAQLMADVVAAIQATGELPEGHLQEERHPLLRWGDREVWHRQAELARDGVAGRLFARWSPLCPDRSTLDLPPDAQRPSEP